MQDTRLTLLAQEKNDEVTDTANKSCAPATTHKHNEHWKLSTHTHTAAEKLKVAPGKKSSYLQAC